MVQAVADSPDVELVGGGQLGQEGLEARGEAGSVIVEGEVENGAGGGGLAKGGRPSGDGEGERPGEGGFSGAKTAAQDGKARDEDLGHGPAEGWRFVGLKVAGGEVGGAPLGLSQFESQARLLVCFLLSLAAEQLIAGRRLVVEASGPEVAIAERQDGVLGPAAALTVGLEPDAGVGEMEGDGCTAVGRAGDAPDAGIGLPAMESLGNMFGDNGGGGDGDGPWDGEIEGALR